MNNKPIKLAVLVSGGGTTLQNLIDEISANALNARIGLVIGSKPDLAAAQRAARASLPYEVIDRKAFPDTASFSTAVFEKIDEAKIDLICLAGWLSLLQISARYEGKVMNVHPALLPDFGGKNMFGLRVHRAVLESGAKISGCTVHFADNSYDNGPIILQRVCPVLDDDTPESLAQRVFEEERIAYPSAIQLFAEGRLNVDGHRVRVRPG